MRTKRVIMHHRSVELARRIAALLGADVAVTTSENHPRDKITLVGFDDVLDDVLPILRTEAPGWQVRTLTYG